MGKKNNKDEIYVDNIEREILKNLGKHVEELEEHDDGGYKNTEYKSTERKSSERKSSERKSTEHKSRAGRNREIVVISYICIVVFAVMIGYLVHFLASDNTDMLSNPYNKLQGILEEYTIRGNILASGGEVLATTEVKDNGDEIRKYPYGNMFAHAVGYIGNGKTGIESEYNIYLLKSGINPIYKAMHELQGDKYTGDSVVTSLDVNLQKVAYNALGSHRGAVLAMNPDTGAIYVMVSKPDYNPEKIASDWKNLTKDSSESVLINRVTQGLYPPGSTFKLITMIEYMRENSNYRKFEYDCNGVADINGVRVNCHNKKAHGKLDINKALAQSCNGAFATMGIGLDIKAFNNTCSSLLYNNDLPYNGVYNKSIFNLPEDADAGLITQTSFGQGRTMVTPLHNGIIAGMIANGGYLITPHLAESIRNNNDDTVKNFSYSKGTQLISDDEVKALRKAMKEVVKSGTAAGLSGRSYKVYGKTGSAEYDSSGASHAWFTGYAEKSDKKIAVSIIVEGAGTGSEYAVPIAGKIFDAYY